MNAFGWLVEERRADGTWRVVLGRVETISAEKARACALLWSWFYNRSYRYRFGALA